MAHKPSKAEAAESDSPAEDEPDDLEDEVVQRIRRPVSVPAKASCLTFVVLVLIVVVWFFAAVLYKQWPDNPFYYLVIVALVVTIPVVVYRAVSLWLFDESARYPDIAYAWNAGISELAQHGMTLDSAPLFVIVGTGSDRMRRSFMSAAGGEFFIDGVCDSGSSLFWYANSDGIFIYLNDVCWANAAISLYEVSAGDRRRGLPSDQARAGAGPQKIVRAMGTLVADFRGPSVSQPARQPEMPSDHDATAPAAEGGADVQVAHGQELASEAYMGTVTPGQVMESAPAGAPRSNAAPVTSRQPVGSISRVTNRLSSQQSSQQLQRLEHFCGLLRRRRHPVCPLNGILALLPFEMLKANDQEVAELERAISADMSTIYNELQLRCPVTAVVVGMDQERGFRELIRRIGREDVAKQRFGQRFDIRTPATVDELRKFTSHVCGTFEDFVYFLFRQEEALSHPGNTALYALLCKVRRTLKTRLGDVLGKGFGYDRDSNKVPVLFSGCYFAATGPKSDRQAFVSGLLSKMYDEQEDIEWTNAALREDRRRGWLIRIGWAITGAVLLGIAVWYIGKELKWWDVLL